MGSRGSRGRDPKDSAPIEFDPTPPVMWPESGSGFEADPFSPAGASQLVWRATRGRPRTRVGQWTVRIIAILVALSFIAAQIVH